MDLSENLGTIIGHMVSSMGPPFWTSISKSIQERRSCVSRPSPPFRDGKPGLNRSGYFNYYSANMHGEEFIDLIQEGVFE